MQVIVLGAGVIGTTSAWYLRKAGHDVMVVDRQRQAASETSFANGGQISVSHAEPWANPSAPLKVLGWLMQADAPLLFRPRWDPAQWQWCLRFLLECRPARTAANIASIVELGLRSRALLGDIRKELGMRYDDLQRGILHFYTSQSEFNAAIRAAEIMRSYGCTLDMLDREQVIKTEPALGHTTVPIVGGSMTPEDESGDACQFTRQLAAASAARGVTFQFGTTVVGLKTDGGVITGVEIRDPNGRYGLLKADAYVVAMGSFSVGLLRRVGINVPVYPAKGYSATLPVRDASRAYTVSLTDDEYKLVFSRLGERLRVAGTAELSGYDMSLNRARCDALIRRTLEIFPGIADPAEAEFWTGLRPATPSNVPIIRRSRFDNLFLNTGHGTLGWTMACGSGQMLADLVSGEPAEMRRAA